MCIRDSRGVVQRHVVEPEAAHPLDLAAQFGRLRLARIGPCLLYTSDAADERSSVDLGGRRIIKKKTKLHIETRR